MTNSKEVMWAAGLFEGEGCIYSRPNRLDETYKNGRSKYGDLRLTLAMMDKDSVDRFRRAVGGLGGVRMHKRAGYYIRTNTKIWEWNVYGFEQVQAVLAMLWSGLGKRRQKKATETLKYWRSRGGSKRDPQTGRFTRTGGY